MESLQESKNVNMNYWRNAVFRNNPGLYNIGIKYLRLQETLNYYHICAIEHCVKYLQ